MTPFRLFAGLFGYNRERSFYARSYNPMQRPTAANWAFEHSNPSGVFMGELFGLGDPPERKTCAVIFTKTNYKGQRGPSGWSARWNTDISLHPAPDIYAQTVILDSDGNQIEVYGWGDHCAELQKKLDHEYVKEKDKYDRAHAPKRKHVAASAPFPNQAELNKQQQLVQDMKNAVALSDSQLIMAKAGQMGQANMDTLLQSNAQMHKAFQDANNKLQQLLLDSALYSATLPVHQSPFSVSGEEPSPGPGLTSDQVLAADAANTPAPAPDTGTASEVQDIAAQYPGIYHSSSKKVRRPRLHGRATMSGLGLFGAVRKKKVLTFRDDSSKGKWVPVVGSGGSPSNMNLTEDKPSSPGTQDGQLSSDGQWQWVSSSQSAPVSGPPEIQPSTPSPDAPVISELKQTAQQVKKQPQRAAQAVVQDAPIIQQAVSQAAAASISTTPSGGATPSLDDPQLVAAMNALVAIMDKFDKPLSSSKQVESLQSKLVSWGMTHGTYMKQFDSGSRIPGLPADVSVQSVVLEYPNEAIGKTAEDVRADMEILRKFLGGKAQIYYWGKKAFDIKKAYDAYQKSPKKQSSANAPNQAQLNKAAQAVQDLKNAAALSDSKLAMAQSGAIGQANMDALLASNAAMHAAFQAASDKLQQLLLSSASFRPPEWVDQPLPSQPTQFTPAAQQFTGIFG